MTHDPAEYGDRWADIYDMYPAHPSSDDTELAADFLSAHANDGAVLEFGIGTGRLTLALVARGLTVHGIDASPAMLEKLSERAGGASIPVTLGDMCTTRVSGEFSLVFSAFNTLLMLPSQEEQVRCFHNAAAHLSSGGRFVVEAFVPEFTKLASGPRLTLRHVDDEGMWLLATRHDPLRQVITNHVVRLGREGYRSYPVALRYAWPTELDLMAQIAGFSLLQRCGDWSGSSFSAAAKKHVSVYELDARVP